MLTDHVSAAAVTAGALVVAEEAAAAARSATAAAMAVAAAAAAEARAMVGVAVAAVSSTLSKHNYFLSSMLYPNFSAFSLFT